jgi:Protein of unknown function (DUF4065)
VAQLKDVVAYLAEKYPHKQELSKARLTKMVYLADWKAAIDRGEQLTDIQWKFNHYGPYVLDVVNTARDNAEFDVIATTNAHGGLKELIRVKVRGSYGSLTKTDKAMLDYIMSETAPLGWDSFMQLVYSTYPVISRTRGETLNLVPIANEYRTAREELDSDPEREVEF